MNVSFHHVRIPLYPTTTYILSLEQFLNKTNNQEDANTPWILKTNSTTLITIAAILGLTILLTGVITVGSKSYHKTFIEKHSKENDDDIITVTSEEQSKNSFPRNSVPMAKEMKSSLVFWKIINFNKSINKKS